MLVTVIRGFAKETIPDSMIIHDIEDTSINKLEITFGDLLK